MKIREALGKRILFYDGGMGTMLQQSGAKPGEVTELWNVERPTAITAIHRQYLEAGADILLANTFGANRLKLKGTGYTTAEIVEAGIRNAQAAIAVFLQGQDRPCSDGIGPFVAVDIAPTGKLLRPLGDLSFDEAYTWFKEVAVAGEQAGADLAQIETMSDTYELKAAVLAVKENTKLPIFATVTFDEKGKMLTGGDVAAVVAMLEGLGVDGLGINCGLGPAQMQPMVREFLSLASVPVVVQPNAGLPRQENGQTVYDVTPQAFAEIMEEFARGGAWLLGGCCGTTPEHIRALRARCSGIKPGVVQDRGLTMVSSYTHAVQIGDDPVMIGERINPTGKSRFKQALRDHDMDYILQEGFAQQDHGAQILDVNVGLPEIDEPALLVDVMREVQGVIDLPLQIDTANVEAMAQALRYYNGKAMINSVNGKAASMAAVFPLMKQYGGVVVGLTLDEAGIPDTAEGRFAIAEKIVNTAETYGIARKDIVIDVLCMTISADPRSAETTLAALKLVKEKLGVRTILGVSNISFGLPQREWINSNFYTMALTAGLDCGIINPNAEGMLNAYHAYRALAGRDLHCSAFIEYASHAAVVATPPLVTGGIEPQTMQKETVAAAGNVGQAEDSALMRAIQKGLKEKAGSLAAEMVKTMDPLQLINTELVPALDRVGKGFEAGHVFLPQLLMSAEAAKAAFEAVRAVLDKSGTVDAKKGKVIVATVKGDIHDIGKNIVKVLLENYGYAVRDLGKDVTPEKIVEAVLQDDVRLVGLSALMTTTVTNMEETIRMLRAQAPDCRVMVGGAVLTEKYAEMIQADYYAKDAMASVYYAQQILDD